MESSKDSGGSCCSDKSKAVDVWSRYTAAITGVLIIVVGILDIIKVFAGK